MTGFTVWVDGDSCPAAIRRIVERAANRRKVDTVFVSDRPLPVEKTDYTSLVIVPMGDDSADDYIVTRVSADDLVVSRDVVLTSRAVKGGAAVIDDSGRVYTRENAGERASIHRFMSSLRDARIYHRESSRSRGAGTKDFADAFDRLLAKKRTDMG